MKVGKHYLPLSDSIIIGVTLTQGSMGAPTILHETDISAVKPQGFTFTRTDLK